MKLRLLSCAAAFCLSIALSAGPGFTQAEEIKPEPELVLQMLQEGWTKVEEGVLQRTEEGPVETFTYGEDGLRWTARSLAARLKLLEKEYARHPAEKLAGVIKNLRSQLIKTEEVLASGAARAEVVSPDELAECSTIVKADATADPKTGSSAPGVMAHATATFDSDCGQIGNSYAYVYARAATSLADMPPPEYYDVLKPDSSRAVVDVSASASGNLDCFSEAYARAWYSEFNLALESAPPANYSCPPGPFTVSISGPLDVRLGCHFLTWNASVTGGSGVTKYKWYFGTGSAVVGTRRSWSRMYCNGINKLITLRVVATDKSSPPKTDEATFTTWIH